MVKDLPKKLEEQKVLVEGFVDSAKSRHEKHRRKWEDLYAQYRSYRDLKAQYGRARTANDVDDAMVEMKRQFGADLVIPYAFATVETVLPRMLTNPPKVSVGAIAEEFEDYARPVKLHIERQQQEIDYELVLQDVGKSGLIYGLGVMKLPYVQDRRTMRALVPAAYPEQGKPEWVEGTRTETIYSGPRPEAIDIFDFIWSPLAHDMATMSACVHRTWRDDRYVRKQLEKRAWKLPRGWDVDDVLGLASGQQRSDIWNKRELYAGREVGESEREGRVHEVWEFDDGEQIITIVNRCVPVASGRFPYWHGQLPFMVYRPTRVPHELVGIGEIEAAEALFAEMNTLRSQRRDNAALVLQRPFAYFDGLVDPDDIAFGPGIGIPVEGDPREVIFPLPIQDIPASGYAEEDRIKADIERTTGLDDSLAGASGDGGAAETATGVQLVQQAANVRITQKTKLLQKEVVRPAARQWLRLNAQFTTEEIRIVGPPKAGEEDREQSYYEIGPREYSAEFFIEPEDGSMEPENPVAKAQQGMQLWQSFANHPAIDQSKLAEHSLELMGVPNPARMLASQEPSVPLHMIDAIRGELVALGQQDPAALEQVLTDPRAFDGLVAQVVQAADAQQQDPAAAGGPPEQPGLPPGA